MLDVPRRLAGLLIFLALGCEPQAPVSPDAVQAPPAGWAERFELVRADLAQLEAAHATKDQDAAVATWEQAYHQRFEPLIEQPAGSAVDVHLMVAVEYAFGRLREAIDSPRDKPTQAALGHLREQLDALEPAVSALPAPLP